MRKEKDPDDLTNGSGSGRPKNMQILQIRIPNTAVHDKLFGIPLFLTVFFRD
jgi:hypothetical protein